MPPVTSLISKFEDIAVGAPVLDSTTTRRVRVQRYSAQMPLRQSTLSFGQGQNIQQTRKDRGSANTRSRTQKTQESTPPAEDITDTIVVAVEADTRLSRVALPTPSETTNDASSQASSTPGILSPAPPRSRRRAAPPPTAKPKASNDTLVGTEQETAQMQSRTVSGETLVDKTADSTVHATLLKDSIDRLDLQWDMGGITSTITVQVETHDQKVDDVDAVEEARCEQNVEKKRLKKQENQKLWEARKKYAEKNATRRSSRRSLLGKAGEALSGLASSVLGKRARDPARIMTPTFEEPHLLPAPSKKQKTDDLSLSDTARIVRSRAPQDKKWLLSGLYAGQTADFNPTLTEAKNKRKSASGSKTGSIKDNSTLPLPMFAGSRLMAHGRDFKLPFDIFSPLAAGQAKPDEWRKVNKNVFVGDAAQEWRSTILNEHSTCMCRSSTGCDSDCMNRVMYYECDSRNCRLSEAECSNRAFEGLRKRVKTGGKFNIGVEVIKTKDRGYGVRANRTFEPHQIIVEYTGEIINQEECERRMNTIYKRNECYYLMAFDQNMIIDATRGSMARFVNHSCAPNCRMEKWTVSGKPRMALFAGERGIMTGEELTYDYNFDPYSQKNVQTCRCGAVNCRGFLGPKQRDQPKKPESSTEEDSVVKSQKKKKGKFAGAKRKIVEVLEESTHLVNNQKKKKQADQNDRLSGKLGKISRRNSGSVLERKPSKLKRLLSTKVRHSMPAASVSTRSRRSTRLISGTSTQGLLDSEVHEAEPANANQIPESDSKHTEEVDDGVNGKRVFSETHLRALAVKARADRLMRAHGRIVRAAA